MKVFSYNINPNIQGYNIEAGNYYLIESAILETFIKLNSIPKTIANFKLKKPFNPVEDWNKKKILAIRHGAFGDLLFLTPIFSEIKNRWSDAEISICCAKKYSEAVVNNPDISAVINYPIKLSEAKNFDAIINFVYSDEHEKKNNKTHIIDLFAELAGLTITNKKLKLPIPDYEINKMFVKYIRTKRTRIGIQVFASNNIRSYPFFLFEKLIDKLWEKGYEIFLFGSQNQIPLSSKDRLINFTEFNPSPSFIESASIMKTCDLFIAPDSSLCHVAGALEIPTIALFGPFPSELRTAHAHSIKSIEGKGDCAPCFHHTFNGKQFPEGMPCEEKGYCSVLANIDPEIILMEIEEKVEVSIKNAERYI